MRADGSDVRVLTDDAIEQGTPVWIPGARVHSELTTLLRVYAASRMSQLRNSSSAASQLRKRRSWPPRPVSSQAPPCPWLVGSMLESSPRSQPHKINEINYLRVVLSTDRVSLIA